jgi:glycosyltransferase involved in cell wall biosynthesis
LNFLSWIIILLAVLYSALILFYRYYWKQSKEWVIPADYKPGITISVIVPMRNEEHNAAPCIQSILNQKYPADKFELLVIDDQSTDQTASTIRNIVDSRLKIFSTGSNTMEAQIGTGKKAAVTLGVENAKGDLVVTTDADCRMGNEWLLSIASAYETSHARFIAAPIVFHREKSLFGAFQSLDLAGLMGITAAGIQSGFHYMCNGANLAFEKDLFFEMEGYRGNDAVASGDDMFFIQKVKSAYPEKIIFLKSLKATVRTLAARKFGEFVQQRLRWGGKNRLYKDQTINSIWAFIWLFHGVLIISPFLAFLWPKLFIPVTILFISKLIVDYIFLGSVTDFFEKKALLQWFLPASVIYAIYVVVIGVLINTKRPYTWKGREHP